MEIGPTFSSDLAGDNREQRLSALSSIEHLLREQIAVISRLQREVALARKLLSDRCAIPDADAIESYLSSEALAREATQAKRANVRRKEIVKTERETPARSEKPASPSNGMGARMRALVAGS